MLIRSYLSGLLHNEVIISLHYISDIRKVGIYSMDLTQSIDKKQARKEPFPISILSLTVGAFAIGMTEFVIMGLLPNVASDLDVSISTAGQLITMYALGVAIGAPILTILTQRIPQKSFCVCL